MSNQKFLTFLEKNDKCLNILLLSQFFYTTYSTLLYVTASYIFSFHLFHFFLMPPTLLPFSVSSSVVLHMLCNRIAFTCSTNLLL
ncbi:hypothetical protein BDQ17DRAFT_1354973 [Cyathus striatus]|nr:hypothetical protein BDQ17DRAFT_1354973 [Cyathus striatus]